MEISQEIPKKDDENSPFDNDKDNNDNSITYYMEDKNINEIENENDIINEENKVNKNKISKKNKKEKKYEKKNEEQTTKSINNKNEEEEDENEEDNEENKINEIIDEEDDSENLLEKTLQKRHFMENTISFNNKIEKSYEKKLNINAKNPKEFDDYLIRLKQYNSKRNEELEELKNKCYLKERRKCTNIPNINKKSKELVKNDNLTFLQRLKKEQERAKIKKKQLEEQIIVERERKKEEELKRNDYKIKKTKIDEKWNKRLNEMNEIQKKNQEKFEQIKKRVKDEEMKEYIFQPKINTSKNKNTKNNNSLNNNDTNNIKKKHKRTGSAIITNRLYNDDLLKRKENKENLIKKYTPTFQPKIDEKSKNMKLNRRKNEYMYRYILFNKTNYDCHNYSYERSNGQSYTNTQWNIHNKLDDSEYEKSEDYILDDENNNNKKYKNYNHNIEIQEIDEEQIDDLNLNKDEINDNIIENKNNE